MEHVEIATEDGQLLSSTILVPENSIAKAVIQFHSGTVLKKEFYLKYAGFLRDQGFIVVLFDYRGVGGSRPKNLRGFEASISDWGRKDAPAVLNFIKTKYPDLRTYLFAHSMGGQILGLMPNWNLFDRIILVASSSGNWHNFHASYRRKVKWSSNLLFPIVLPTVGYAIGRLGLGDDWPKGVATEWWENSQQNSRMADYMTREFKDTYYSSMSTRIRAIFFEDDPMATQLTVPNIQKSYPKAEVITEVIDAATFGLPLIGHFGLFKERTKGPLWDLVIRDFI